MFVAVHVGAGKHSDAKWNGYKKLCKKACARGMDLLRSGVDSNKVVVEVSKILEDSPLTNAGTGSQLTVKGTVECDASIMDSNGSGMGIGSVSGVTHPTELALQCLDELQKPKHTSFGRTLPRLLNGQSGVDLTGHPTCQDEQLITKESLAVHLYWKDAIANQTEVVTTGDRDIDETIASKTDVIEDTVGVICFDLKTISVGSSSGGPTMKPCGRIGPAAILGSGIHVQSINSSSSDSPTTPTITACCASGHGETIMERHLASKCCTLVQTHQGNVDSALCDALGSSDPPYVGVMLTVVSPDYAELGYAFGTDSMILGYASERNSGVIAERKGSTTMRGAVIM
uniref:ARAD1C38764p n=1 Tax=Blastobotrys adeninivorans TaxID=409370 RepID=A0A060T446_BLAAD